MIAHFLLRDFLDYKTVWAFALAVTVGAFLFLPDSVSIPGLAYLYFLLSLMPIQTLTGMTWRGQFALSRNYLLSLPVSRTHLFWIIQLRGFAYSLPLMILAIAAPLLLVEYRLRLTVQGFSFPVYLLTALTLWFWCINRLIGVTTDWERVGAHQPMGARMRIWLLSLVPWGLEVFVIIFCLISFRFAPSPFLCLVPLMILATFRFVRSRKAWLGGI